MSNKFDSWLVKKQSAFLLVAGALLGLGLGLSFGVEMGYSLRIVPPVPISEPFPPYNPAIRTAFFGAFAGASIGLGTMLLGHLFNARLNRQRDTEIRNQEAAALAATFIATNLSLINSCKLRKNVLSRRIADALIPLVEFPIPIEKIGLFGARIAYDIAALHGIVQELRVAIAENKISTTQMEKFIDTVINKATSLSVTLAPYAKSLDLPVPSQIEISTMTEAKITNALSDESRSQDRAVAPQA